MTCYRSGILVSILSLLLAGGPFAAAAPEASPVRRTPTVEAVEKAMPTVVNIGTQELVETRDPFDEFLKNWFGPYYQGQPRGREYRYNLGSGVLIDEDGFVLTNAHVIRRATRIWVKLMDGREFEADVVVSNANSDVALLKLRNDEEETFHTIEFAEDDDLLLGETVIALGNPFGLGGSVSRGILSSKNRRPPTEDRPLDIADWLQTDAAINPGNSGGPLINLDGRLIGINVAVMQAGQGIGFAIPIRQVSRALSKTLTPEGVRGLWFGAQVTAGSLPLTVSEVQPESPAAQAGLREGDVIVSVKGSQPRGFIEFNRLLMRGNENQDVEIVVQRNGKNLELVVRLIPESAFFNAELIRKKLGLNLQPLTRELAEALNLSFYGGFVISGIDRASPAAEAHLERGDVIRALDDTPARDLVEAARLLHAKPAGETVTLSLVYQSRRGPYLAAREYRVELKVR